MPFASFEVCKADNFDYSRHVLSFEIVKQRLVEIQNGIVTLLIGQIKSEIAFSISERGLVPKMIGFKKQKKRRENC